MPPVSDFYEENAESYVKGTFGIDIEGTRREFLSYVPEGGRILDLGFGSGRDMLAFRNAGYQVVGIDPCLSFVHMARSMGLEALPLKAGDMTFENEFDGIWASASLLHSEDLTEALGKCHKALKERGVLYCSFKKGSFRGMRDGRFYVDMEPVSLKNALKKAGFSPLSLWTSEDSSRPGLLWTNGIFRKSRKN